MTLHLPSLLALAATVAAEIRGRACPACLERHWLMGAHRHIDHADLETP